MDKLKQKNGWLSHIYIALMFCAVFIKEVDTKNIITIAATVLSFIVCLDFYERINLKYRLIPIIPLAVVGVANSFDYLFFTLPFILLIACLTEYISEKTRLLNFEMILSAILIAAEIIVLFVLKESEDIKFKLDLRFIACVSLFILIFVAMLILFIVKTNFLTYVKKIRKLKKKKTISKNDCVTLEEYKRIKNGAVFCFYNICFCVNIMMFCLEKLHSNSSLIFAVLIILFYMLFIISKTKHLPQKTVNNQNKL